MHCFCTYLNLKLPSNPNYPDAKAFTGQHFRLIDSMSCYLPRSDCSNSHYLSTDLDSEKNSLQKNQIYILQTSVNPPHFNFALKEDDIIEIPPGRNNVFHTIIVFLYFIKTKHYGFLG